MTRTGKTAIQTVAAPGAGVHVKDANPTHDHDNAETDASAAALIAAHEAKFHGPVVEPPVVEPPVVIPPGGKSVTVSSIESLKAAIGDDSNDEVVVRDGTYAVAGAGFQQSTSLWIDQMRTRPVLIRAATPYGVTFDGGSRSVGHISFEDGACFQTWDGFVLAGGIVSHTGSIVMGGYVGLASPHDITLRRIRILGSVKGSGTTAQGQATDHAVYGSESAGSGPVRFTLEDIDIDCSGGLASGFHFYHSEAGNPNCSNWIVRRFRIAKAQQALILWDDTMHGMVFEDGTITNSSMTAVTYHNPTSGNVLRRVNSTGSGQAGLSAPNGQGGLTVESSSLA